MLSRLRGLAEMALVNVDRAERIRQTICHGPEPCNPGEDRRSMDGLEDIYEALRSAVYGLEERLICIESKLGK
jgi:hypothetical protein